MSGKRRQLERQAQLRARLDREKRDAIARGEGVDREALVPNNSYGWPDFVERGYYVDQCFVCRDCGASEFWTAAQQKWWYEVAKGSQYSTASRCRPCRKRERIRKEQAQIPEALRQPVEPDP